MFQSITIWLCLTWHLAGEGSTARPASQQPETSFSVLCGTSQQVIHRLAAVLLQYDLAV